MLITLAVAAVAGIGAGAVGGWIIAQYLHVPQVDELATFRPASTTEVLAPTGETLASYALERRIELTDEEIPEQLKLAIVAIEDADFFEHGGVDPKAIARAAVVTLRNLVRGSDQLITQGGSTLTQQLALNLFLKRERTLQRKIKEALLAIDIEKRYSKDQILTLYANQIFFGHGAYGVEAASRLYFDKPALELTLAESAMLAGMIPSANNRYNPFTRPDATLARRNKVLDRMLELGFIETGGTRRRGRGATRRRPPPGTDLERRLLPRDGSQGHRGSIRHGRALHRRAQGARHHGPAAASHRRACGARRAGRSRDARDRLSITRPTWSRTGSPRHRRRTRIRRGPSSS